MFSIYIKANVNFERRYSRLAITAFTVDVHNPLPLVDLYLLNFRPGLSIPTESISKPGQVLPVHRSDFEQSPSHILVRGAATLIANYDLQSSASFQFTDLHIYSSRLTADHFRLRM